MESESQKMKSGPRKEEMQELEESMHVISKEYTKVYLSVPGEDQEQELVSVPPFVSPGETPLAASLWELDEQYGQPTWEVKNKKQYFFKVVVMGEIGVGKTSIIKTYLFDYFSHRYRPTAGVEIAQKLLDLDNDTSVMLQFWDIAGEERVGMMAPAYLQHTNGAVIVYDVTNQDPFRMVESWKRFLDLQVFLPDGSYIPCLLLGNKCDLLTVPSDNTKMKECYEKNNFYKWFEVSAKMNFNLEAAFSSLAAKPKERHFKVLMLGRYGCGKTSIVNQYLNRYFCQTYAATIGADCIQKTLPWNENNTVKLHIWDIEGQEHTETLTRTFFKAASGAVAVYDVTSKESFKAVTRWKHELDSKVSLPDGSPLPCILLANKCDLDEEGTLDSCPDTEFFCQEYNFATYFKTSARRNINIDEAFLWLSKKMMENRRAFKNRHDLLQPPGSDESGLFLRRHEHIYVRNPCSFC